MRRWLGFEKWFDFSHQHTLSGKLKNLLLAFAIDLLWTTLASATLLFAVHFSKASLIALLGNPIRPWALYATLLSAGFSPLNLAKLFFLACVWAPLTEELLFRFLPITFARFVSARRKPAPVAHEASTAKWKPNLLFWTCCASSILFGLAHGSVLNILFQGASGFLFCWVYLKNGNSYWSAVAAHSLWNFMVIFGLRLLPLS